MSKWSRYRFIPNLPLGDDGKKVTLCNEHIMLSKKAAADGMVLLKNNGILPLRKGEKIAVFGKGQSDYVKGGGGSGDVHTLYCPSLLDALRKTDICIFEPLSNFYESYVKASYSEGKLPGQIEEVVPSEVIADGARAFCDIAVFVISRFSSEGWDRNGEKGGGDYYLSASEEKLLDLIKSRFEKICVILNIGAVSDVSWFANDEKIGAALIMWQPGMLGCEALSDIITGSSTPSGKLVDTFATSLDDYPSTESMFKSDDVIEYSEDIFVGYRYFETIPDAKDKVIYPFGYGLSYTTFDISSPKLELHENEVVIKTSVTNTGNTKGREVVQIYVTKPAQKLTQPKYELVAFRKTELLMPGDTELIKMKLPVELFVSYDENGVIAKSSYVMEKGRYIFSVGNSVRNLKKTNVDYELGRDLVVRTVKNRCQNTERLEVMQSDGSFTVLEAHEIPERVKTPSSPDYLPSDEKQSIRKVISSEIGIDDFLKQMSDDELIHLLSGHPGVGVSDTSGIGAMPEYDIPTIMTADGPAGLRTHIESEVLTTAFPCATLIASTWDTKIAYEIGVAGAKEVLENNIPIWLTPAMNIHRNPLCGRNFEYYSEDPLVTGYMGSAMASGIQSIGISACPKHFACNNKENNRYHSDSRLSERALREIYLKGFAMCVFNAEPKLIMTAYNKLNGIHASERHDLIQGILREEMGYKGAVTSDWVNAACHYKEILAGNDLKMPFGDPVGVKNALENNEITRDDLVFSAKKILEFILSI